MKQPDFPIIIQRLNKKYSLRKIAELTTIAPPTLASVKTEGKEVPVSWSGVWNLLKLYEKTCEQPIPIYGEHNEP